MFDQERAESAVVELLLAIGEDPKREGLIETPKRVAKMYAEVFSGLHQSPKDVLKFFDGNYSDEIIVVKDIPFYSMCEHHLLPFYGVAHIAYIPAPNRLLGLSKLARIVDGFAKKPQLQEKLSREIVNFLLEETDCVGAAIVIEAEHLCMSMRGVKKPGSKTITRAFVGTLSTNESLKLEAMSLLK